jgi:catechol 2,3-dioxygenase-like lactoylglutathione lyase family enzyme
MPAVTSVLETCIYAEDLDRVARFYEELFGWKPMVSDARIRAYGVAKGSVLLLFRQGFSREPVVTPEGVIPAHEGVPGGHLALSISAEQWEPWLQHLEARGIAVERIMRWPRGGQSMYFRDPEGNLVELATPGVWAVY